MVDRTEPHNFGGDVRILPAWNAHVCTRAGLENFAWRDGGRSEGTRRGRCGAPALEILTAPPACRRANRLLTRAHHGCGVVHSWCRESRVGRYRIKTRRKLHCRSRCEPRWLQTETRAGPLSHLE